MFMFQDKLQKMKCLNFMIQIISNICQNLYKKIKIKLLKNLHFKTIKEILTLLLTTWIVKTTQLNTIFPSN